jgi:hypothetical protein
MAARSALPLLVAALLVVAGCNAPTGPPSATPGPSTVDDTDTTATPTPSEPTRSPAATPDTPTISVEGGRLAVDPDRVFRRVSRQLGADVAPPERIRIVDPATMETSLDPPPFLRVLGVRAPASTTGLSARSIGTDLLQINRSVATRPRVEPLLAHEFVHVVQHRRDVTAGMFESTAWRSLPYGVERRLLIAGVQEGAATYAATRYQRADAETLPQGERYREGYRHRDTAAGRYFMAPYWFGYRYVADRLGENGSLETVYDRPPRTTEALVHGLEPGAEPPADLPVTVTADRWRPDDRERVGELGTRIALSASLNRSRAAAGADGWGNDVFVPFRRGEKTGYVWVLRWDDAANETEFRTAFTAALDRRANRTSAGWRVDGTAFRLRRGDERTTVVLAGQPGFVRNASVDVGRRVTVRGP